MDLFILFSTFTLYCEWWFSETSPFLVGNLHVVLQHIGMAYMNYRQMSSYGEDVLS